MPRILAIDYGNKRVGLAVTDNLQLIATGLETVHASEVLAYLADYVNKEQVALFVVGMPKDLRNRPTDATQHVVGFVRKLQKAFPTIPVELADERFTSKLAFQAMIDGGLKKADRRDKGMVDKVSAVIILQSYLEGRMQA